MPVGELECPMGVYAGRDSHHTGRRIQSEEGKGILILRGALVQCWLCFFDRPLWSRLKMSLFKIINKKRYMIVEKNNVGERLNYKKELDRIYKKNIVVEI